MEIIDQQNNTDIKKFQPSFYPKIGQIFYPSISGQLSAITLYIRLPLNVSYKVNIYDDQDKLLNTTEFICVSTPQKVYLSEKPTLEAGKKYKFFVESPVNFFIIWITLDNNYNGVILDNSIDGQLYELKSANLAFITHMIN